MAMAKGDFAHLVEVLKQMEPGLAGCEVLAKARRMAPNTVAKMNGDPGPAYEKTFDRDSTTTAMQMSTCPEPICPHGFGFAFIASRAFYD